jgi:hypothetical protein
VWSSVVVSVEVEGEGCGAFGRAAVDPGVGPFVEERLDQSFGFPVGAWPVWLDPEVAEAELPGGCGRTGG